MKKRILSGLLAAVLLFVQVPSAFAAPAEQTAQPTALSFAITLPDGTAAMTNELAAKLQNVLGKRLQQLALQDATITLADDNASITVTLPANAEIPADLAAYLAQPNVLAITDAAGTIALTGEDLLLAQADQPAQGDGGAAYILLTPSDEAQKALAGLAADDTISVTLDGAAIGNTVTYDADTATLSITGGFDLNAAKLYVARITGGTLPVTLTETEPTDPAEPTEPTDPTDPNEPEEPEEPAEPTEPIFPDIAGHWAADALNRAVEYGLLNGVGGKMLPDNAVKRSEAIVILNRALGATVADDISSLTGTPSTAWYATDLGKALHLGLIDTGDSRNFDTAATRAEAFVLFARAFVYGEATDTNAALAAFSDTGSMTTEQRQAAAVLVEAGIVTGKGAGQLAPSASLTRAEFVTMLLRIAPNLPAAQTATEEPDETESSSETPALQAGGTLITDAEYTLQNQTHADDVIFACPAQDVRLDACTVNGRVVLKGAEQTALYASNGTSLDTLALDPAGSADAKLNSDSQTGALLIAGRGGAITVSGQANTVLITANGRTIDLSGLNASSIRITGSDNTITVNGKADTVTIVGGAKNNTLTLNQSVGTLTVAGIGSKVNGRGHADTVDIRAVDCEVSISASSKVENIDAGLAGVSIEMGVPTKVTPGGSLLTQVKFTGVSETETKICSAQWYQDGKPLEGYKNDAFALTPDAVSRHTTYFTFTKDMQTSVTMGFKLTYENPSTGETEEVYAEKTVPIENYSDEWYYQRDVNRILNLVSSTYRGNYTTAYAVNNDYKSYEKEVWVNAKGYSSSTNYLIWVNRAYPHANVFQGSKGNWKLVKSFLVGIGASSTPTPTGVTTVSYKSSYGWTTSTYTVRPVVGFYPGTGYAFHSRLCYPGTDTEYDFSAGYPISHGCVRMYKSDINWIYNNIPVGTTVVIY